MPETRNSNPLSINQLQAILDNDRIRQHLVQVGYIDRQGNIIRKAEDNHQSKRPLTANTRQGLSKSMILPNRPRVTENGRSRSPDYNSNDRRLKSASTNRSKGTNKSIDSTRVQNVLLRRAVSPLILPANNRCLITLTYYGPSLNIEYNREWFEPDGDEIMIMQQHCGGENYLVFKGSLKPKDIFSFQSRRHSDYPFALAFYWNGVMKDRLSICCESRCNNFMRIGGQRCLIAITKVENSRPCRRCRFEQRMKKLMEGLPKPVTIVDRRYHQQSSKTRKSNSKSPSARNLSADKKESDKSNSKSSVPETIKSKRSGNRTPSADSTESDASDSKPNVSRIKSPKTKANRSSRSKASDSEISSPEPTTTHKRSPDTNQDRSSSPKKSDSDVLNPKPIASHVKPPETKKVRPPSPKEVDSDVSNTDPTESHIRSSGQNKVHSSSPQQVDSIPSSPEPSSSYKKFSSTKSARLPSPEPVDSDSSDSKPPAPYKQFSKTDEPRSSSPGERHESSSPIKNLLSNASNNQPQSANSSNNFQKPENKPNSLISSHHRKKSNEDSPSDSSEDNRKNQPRVLRVEAKKTADEINSDSDDI